MWTKVEKTGRGRGRRTKFGVLRNKKNCFLLIPGDGEFEAGGFTEYFTGNGMLAFTPSNMGYAVYAYAKSCQTLRACIPSTIAHHFPTGTTDIEVTRDGDMYVIDLSQFPAQEAAQ